MAFRLTAPIVVIAAATFVACYEPPPPRPIELWTWSTGPAHDTTAELVDAFNRAQARERVEVGAWPVEDRSAPTGAALVAALESASEERRAPALAEVPDVALPALVSADLAWDLDGRDAKRLGVLWQDYRPFLSTRKALGASDGIAAVPYLLEASLLALRAGSGRG